MITVGLTGNVASGKSIVAAHFASWGATVLDADQLVREVQAPGTPTHAAIVDAFGRDVLLADGTLNRSWLRRRILHDDAARSRLNGIVHPAVRERRAQLVAEAAMRGDAILVNDIPLLFEVLDPDQFDLIVLVDAPPDVRRQRLVEHRGLTTDDAERLITAQLPSAAKRGRSHIVIDNVGSLADLERVAGAAWRDVRRAAARASDAGHGSLVIVVAHGDDVLATMRGTMARYGEAGVAMRVVSGTSAPPAETSAASLALGRRPGALDPDDAAAIDRVIQAITESRPTSVVSFGPDGLNGHVDHCAVHSWVRRALDHLSTAPRLVYFADPAHRAAAPGRPPAFGIDVRPWVRPERWRARVAKPCGLRAGSARPKTDLPGREWYREAVAGGDARAGLLGHRSPVDRSTEGA